MNNLKKYLLLSLVLLVGSASAMESENQQQVCVAATTEIQPQEPVANASKAVQKFEKLMQKALKTQTPSLAKRTGVFALRELAKFAPIIFLILAFVVFEKNTAKTSSLRTETTKPTTQINENSLEFLAGRVGVKVSTSDGGAIERKDRCVRRELTVLIAACAQVFTPALADYFIHSKDHSLAALKNIEKYIESLNTDQKKEIAQLFKKNYMNVLQTKVSKEDSHHFGVIFDLVVDAILLMFVSLYGIINHYRNWPTLLCLSLMPISDSIVNIRNFYSADAQKSHVLYRLTEQLKH